MPTGESRSQYIFGPVPSRRLGRSLGVDLVPYKICSYDCIYCQLGRTTQQTVTRKPYVPLSDVLQQLWQRLDEGNPPDYITLSGSGEPTLHSEIGSLIKAIKERTDIPLAVLTNGSLLWDGALRMQLLEADLVIPSLDAGDAWTFQNVNRPHPALQFERIVEGLTDFRKVYSGNIWLEVFLVHPINTSATSLDSIKRYAEQIGPNKIQLNTVIRPPAEEWATRVPDAEMERIREFFGNAEVIAPYQKHSLTPEKQGVADEVLALLRRRPCTLEDIANGLGMHRNEVLKHLQQLQNQNLLRQVFRNGVLYYQIGEK
jgi:wyosine [tRNA(Phe)-imidazoG37] synthetase (radical SAM superfamily)